MAEFKEVLRKRNEICNYHNNCKECPLNGLPCGTFDLQYSDMKALEEIVINWKKSVDWSKVKVDTKILVRMSDKSNWRKRYFAKYEDGIVYAFCDGRTSWSTENTINWNCAKLWEGEE